MAKLRTADYRSDILALFKRKNYEVSPSSIEVSLGTTTVIMRHFDIKKVKPTGIFSPIKQIFVHKTFPDRGIWATSIQHLKWFIERRAPLEITPSEFVYSENILIEIFERIDLLSEEEFAIIINKLGEENVVFEKKIRSIRTSRQRKFQTHIRNPPQ